MQSQTKHVMEPDAPEVLELIKMVYALQDLSKTVRAYVSLCMPIGGLSCVMAVVEDIVKSFCKSYGDLDLAEEFYFAVQPIPVPICVEVVLTAKTDRANRALQVYNKMGQKV